VVRTANWELNKFSFSITQTMPQRRFFSSLVQFAALLLACQLGMACRTSSVGGNAAAGNSDLVDISCYYSCDEKYYLDQKEADRTLWLRQLVLNSDLPRSEFDHYDLFSHKGGGPAGAEWNSDGEIIVFCRIALPVKQVGEISISLNGKSLSPANLRGSNSSGVIILYEVSPDQWMSRLAPIKKKDYSLIYDVQAIENLKNQPGSPLGVGKILKIQVEVEQLTGGKSKTLSITKAFHHSSGE
jgi:hypothetical protein